MPHAAPAQSDVHIGCSGWSYKHWRGDFYPEELPTTRWLDYYATRFNTVEINNSFYRLPDAETFAAWQARVPAGFTYAVKASRFLTHMKKLKDADEPVQRFFDRARSLGRTMGPVLYQLPPRWPVNLERLNAFLEILPHRRRHAIEFRDSSWYADAVFDTLARHRVALCLHDMAGSTTTRLVTGPFIYVRFHGPVRYGGRYSDHSLADWAEWLTTQRDGGRPVYAYFNNDTAGHAPRDATRLRELIGV